MSEAHHLNKFLLKQIQKKVGSLENIPPEILPLIEAISQTYDHYERERHLIERSMDLSSHELMDANELLSEQTKLLQKSNEELKQFGYAVSHDLKEPLRTIAGYVQLIQLRTKGQLSGETIEFMDFVVSGVKRMQQMLEAMLQYAQVDGMLTPPVPVSLMAIVTIVRSNMRETLNANEAKFQYPDNLPEINGHQTQLVQVFQNLLSNSIKFKSEKPPVISLTFRTLNKNHLFLFTDNGIGIPISERDKVFHIFKRGHVSQNYEGIGMGLSICKKIIENHGGEMWLDDFSEDNGCHIRFTLPVIR